MKKLMQILALSTMISTLMLSSSLTVEEIKKSMQATGNIQNEDTSSIVIKDKDKKIKKTSSTTVNDDTYEDVATYYLLVKDEQKNIAKPTYASVNKGLMEDNVAHHKLMIKELKAESDKNKSTNTNKVKEDSIVYMSGYCSIRNAVNVEQIQGYGLLDCNFNNNELGIEATTLMVSFIPIPDKSALIAKPIYIQKGNQKVPISSGVILTIDRTSLNIANFINDKKLEKQTKQILTKASQLALDSASAYMQQKELSRTSEQVAYNNSNGESQIVKTTNTESPKASDYLVNFGIQLASGLVGVVGGLMQENNYPLFKVYKNSQFYADFSIKYSKQNKKVIDYLVKDYNTIKERDTSKDTKVNFTIPTVSTGN